MTRLWPLFYVPPLAAVVVGALLARETPRPLEPSRFDEARAWKLLEDLCALGPRADEPVRQKAFERVRADAREWGAARTWEQDFRVKDRPALRGWNVLAEYPGEGPLAAERVAVVGHFDSVPGAPGALDDGTGTALLAGLGRSLAGRKLARTVVLCAVDLEERGLCGTRHFLESESAAGTLGRWRAGISTEMLGWRDGAAVLHTFPTAFHRPPETWPPGGGLAPRWLAGLALATERQAGRATHFGDRWLFPAYHVVFRHWVTPFESDSGAFAACGIPALFLSDCSFTRFYPQYHTPGDTIDRVDRARFAEAGRALEALVLALAERPALPRADEGVPEAETDYFTMGPWVVPSLALRIALALAPLPCLLFAWRRAGTADRPARGGFALSLVLAAATAVALAAAPVAAFVVLFAAWLAAPLALCRSLPARALGALLALAPALFVGGVIAAAMMSFKYTLWPVKDAWALFVVAGAALGLAAAAFLPRRARTVGL